MGEEIMQLISINLIFKCLTDESERQTSVVAYTSLLNNLQHYSYIGLVKIK